MAVSPQKALEHSTQYDQLYVTCFRDNLITVRHHCTFPVQTWEIVGAPLLISCVQCYPYFWLSSSTFSKASTCSWIIKTWDLHKFYVNSNTVENLEDGESANSIGTTVSRLFRFENICVLSPAVVLLTFPLSFTH